MIFKGPAMFTRSDMTDRLARVYLRGPRYLYGRGMAMSFMTYTMLILTQSASWKSCLTWQRLCSQSEWRLFEQSLCQMASSKVASCQGSSVSGQLVPFFPMHSAAVEQTLVHLYCSTVGKQGSCRGHSQWHSLQNNLPKFGTPPERQGLGLTAEATRKH